MKHALWVVALIAGPAFAADDPIAHAYPPGSIGTREQAAGAMQAARARAEEIEREFKLESARCEKVVLVTGCRSDARRKRDARLREVERVRLEVRDLTRRLDAQERAQARAADAARRAEQAATRAEQGAQSRAAFEARQRAAEQRQPKAPEPRGQKSTPAPSELSARERTENARRLQEKQRAAAEYAQRKAKEREENARRREQRRLEREAEAKRRAAAASK